MAKKVKITQTSKENELKIVNPQAAGIDIADSDMQICGPADRGKRQCRQGRLLGLSWHHF